MRFLDPIRRRNGGKALRSACAAERDERQASQDRRALARRNESPTLAVPPPGHAYRAIRGRRFARHGDPAHMGGNGAPYRQLRNRPPVNAGAAVYAASPEIKFRSKSK
jgi:hypothetical protein